MYYHDHLRNSRKFAPQPRHKVSIRKTVDKCKCMHSTKTTVEYILPSFVRFTNAEQHRTGSAEKSERCQRDSVTKAIVVSFKVEYRSLQKEPLLAKCSLAVIQLTASSLAFRSFDSYSATRSKGIKILICLFAETND
jgi:hypothetical protein